MAGDTGGDIMAGDMGGDIGEPTQPKSQFLQPKRMNLPLAIGNPGEEIGHLNAEDEMVLLMDHVKSDLL